MTGLKGGLENHDRQPRTSGCLAAAPPLDLERPPLNAAQHRLPRRPTAVALNFCLLNWLIPGAGYVAAGDLRRGLTLMVVINAVVVAGVAWGGYVLKPELSFRSPEFNIVAVLTYLVQFFHGGAWLALQFLHGQAAETPDAFFHLHRLAILPFSDLGVFHLIVAGGLNYHCTVRLYDLLAGNPALTESLEQSASMGAAGSSEFAVKGDSEA